MARRIGTCRPGRLARKRCLVATACVVAFNAAGTPRAALAAGFLNNMQSTSAASVSTAGETAIAEDAGTVYYNPAGMTLLRGPEILISSGFVFLSNDFKNGGTTAPLGDPARGLTGNNDEFFAVPGLFATAPLSDRLSVGFGVFNPFGQVNKYSDNWVGRYQLQSISMKSADIDPTIAYRISDNLSIGGGIDIQYAHFKRKSALDLGALCFATIGPANCSGLGLLPQSADGRIAVDAADWSVGFNLSALYNLSDSTHIGLNYRSSVRHDFSGDADFTLPAAAGPLTAGGQFRDTSVRSSVTFPEIIALGLSQKIDDRLTLLVDVDWTRWSRIKQITFNFGNPLQPPQSLLLNWEDGARFSVGGIYRLATDTDLRAGFAYDQSAASDAFRSADLPDADLMMFSAGLTHRFDDRFSATFSYSYSHYANAPVNLSLPGAGTLVGTFHRSSHGIGLQAREQF